MQVIHIAVPVLSSIHHRRILGVNLAVTDYAGVFDAVRAAVAAREQIRLAFCNVHVTMAARELPALMAALNHPAALTAPDGMPLVWAMRSWGEKIRTRVYGPDFFERCLAAPVDHGFKHFFYGSTDDTLAKLKAAAATRFPNAQIAGMHAPPFRALDANEEDEVARMINASGATILWVALGAPKQELWIARMADKLTCPALVAVGAGFDFIAGTVKQAPDWMQDHGLEWLYRFIQEPRRLWWRYCYYNPLFIARVLWERLRGGREEGE